MAYFWPLCCHWLTAVQFFSSLNFHHSQLTSEVNYLSFARQKLPILFYLLFPKEKLKQHIILRFLVYLSLYLEKKISKTCCIVILNKFILPVISLVLWNLDYGQTQCFDQFGTICVPVVFFNYVIYFQIFDSV